jgi:hypothetical protein
MENCPECGRETFIVFTRTAVQSAVLSLRKRLAAFAMHRLPLMITGLDIRGFVLTATTS